jgi:hypothetical protein
LSHTTSPFLCWVFLRWGLPFCGRWGGPGWPWITILLISASWVVRITSVRHQHPALSGFLLYH